MPVFRAPQRSERAQSRDVSTRDYAWAAGRPTCGQERGVGSLLRQGMFHQHRAGHFCFALRLQIIHWFLFSDGFGPMAARSRRRNSHARERRAAPHRSHHHGHQSVLRSGHSPRSRQLVLGPQPLETKEPMISFPKRILVRGVNWLGDAVMSTPALERLREAAPDSEITLLTHEKLAGLFQDYPHIDHLITFTKPEGVFSIARRLRAKDFELALAFPNSHRSALEVFFARIPRRVGYGRAWLLTQSMPRPPVRMRKRSIGEIKSLVEQGTHGRETFPTEAHHTHNYLNLISAPWAPPRLHVHEDEVAEARKRLPKAGA